MRNDLEISEKKYLEILKEKEDLKSKLEINSDNKKRKESICLTNLNHTIDFDSEIKTSRNSESHNLFNEFKKFGKIKEKTKYKMTMNTMIKENNESDDDDLVNKTISIDSNQKIFSNFAMFNKTNLTSRNPKVKLNFIFYYKENFK